MNGPKQATAQKMEREERNEKGSVAPENQATRPGSKLLAKGSERER